MQRPFATMVLAGGKGTRMGSADKHKVCFEVLGVPVIIRALETYNLCGSLFNVIVVGAMAESVMTTVSHRFPGTAFAFQEKPLGTGDAARKGAQLLERMRFEGDVLVVAGDKVIEPRLLRRLLAAHQQSGAALTLATSTRPKDSTSGILLKSRRGNIVGILEEAERQRLVALAAINEAFGSAASLSREVVERILSETCSDRAARGLRAEIWRESSTSAVLKREDFELKFNTQERFGRLRIGKETVGVNGLLDRFNQVNLSTYVFRAPVLYDALSRLKSGRASQEEYLTDVIALLAGQGKPARVMGYQIPDPDDLMGFNNPQELLALEQVYRRKEGLVLAEAPAENGESLALPVAWDRLLAQPSAPARRRFWSWYGEHIPWGPLRDVVAAFVARYGGDRKVAVVRSPGRINLMGRHIDHQGGSVNVMAVNREIFLVAAPRNDDVVSLSNKDGSQFSEQVFRISDLVANLNWDDWQRVVDGPRLQRLLEMARGDWANYVKAAILRLQEQFRDRQLRGLDIMVSGDIPMGAGLSSSSALVVATAEVVRVFNQLPVSARRLVSLCGEGEWFVGTRGGAADHAAIKLSHRGCVTRVGFFPFRLEDSARFFPDHDLLACNSGIYAGKSSAARDTFNAKVTAYHIGRIWLKMLRPDLAHLVNHLRDVAPGRLGLSRAEFARILLQIPKRLTRAQVQAAFGQIAETERTALERLFQSHDSPQTGYAVRDVVLFGLSEMARARHCLDMLRNNDAVRLGKLMSISHDGDRVSRHGPTTGRQRLKKPADNGLMNWAQKGGRGDLAGIPGAYGCSLPELDRIVDIAASLPGVEGAQLAGAGLGGCIMALVQRPYTAVTLQTLAEAGIRAEVFRPIAGAASLSLT